MSKVALFAAALMVAAGSAAAQDVVGVENCAVEKTMERRTGCLQSNVNYLHQLIGKNAADAQQKLAEETRDQEAARKKQKIETRILPLEKFYLAEDYHQKFSLRGDADLMRELAALYPNDADFVNPTAAAKVNAYLSGHGDRATLDKEIDLLGLSAEGKKKLLDRVK